MKQVAEDLGRGAFDLLETAKAAGFSLEVSTGLEGDRQMIILTGIILDWDEPKVLERERAGREVLTGIPRSAGEMGREDWFSQRHRQMFVKGVASPRITLGLRGIDPRFLEELVKVVEAERARAARLAGLRAEFEMKLEGEVEGDPAVKTLQAELAKAKLGVVEKEMALERKKGELRVVGQLYREAYVYLVDGEVG